MSGRPIPFQSRVTLIAANVVGATGLPAAHASSRKVPEVMQPAVSDER